MISAVIFAVIAISLSAAATYTILTLLEVHRINSMGAETANSLLAAATILEANLRPTGIGEPIAAPAGIIDADYNYTTLPDWIGAPSHSPLGLPFAYCPRATVDYAAAVLPDKDDKVCWNGCGTVGEVAFATVTRDAEVNGQPRPYVVRGTGYTEMAGAGMDESGARAPLAFIIAPRPTGSIVPNCGEIFFAGGRFDVPNGAVRAIYPTLTQARDLLEQKASAIVHVAPVAAADDPTGLDALHPISLQSALGQWVAHRPRNFNLRLIGSADPYTDQLDLLNLVEIASAGEGSVNDLFDGNASAASLVLEGPSTGTPATLTPPGSIRIPVDHRLEDLTTAAEVIVPAGVRAVFRDVQLGALRVEGGEVFIQGTVTVTGDADAGAPAVTIAAGTLNIVNRGSGGRPELVLGGSPAGAQIGVRTDAAGRLVVHDGGLLANDANYEPVLALTGQARIAGGSTVRGTDGAAGPVVRLLPGASLVLDESSEIGAAAAQTVTAIEDQGAVLISGTGNVYAATTCWTTLPGPVDPANSLATETFGVFSLSSASHSLVRDPESLAGHTADAPLTLPAIPNSVLSVTPPYAADISIDFTGLVGDVAGSNAALATFDAYDDAARFHRLWPAVRLANRSAWTCN